MKIVPKHWAKLAHVARQTRAWAERENEKLDRLFGRDLCGMCAIAAAELFKRLGRNGFIARIVANDGHCFVEVFLEDDKTPWVVDVTATQFGEAAVLISRHADLKRGWWRAARKFNSVEDLAQWQKRIGWPAEQVAVC